MLNINNNNENKNGNNNENNSKEILPSNKNVPIQCSIKERLLMDDNMFNNVSKAEFLVSRINDEEKMTKSNNNINNTIISNPKANPNFLDNHNEINFTLIEDPQADEKDNDFDKTLDFISGLSDRSK